MDVGFVCYDEAGASLHECKQILARLVDRLDALYVSDGQEKQLVEFARRAKELASRMRAFEADVGSGRKEKAPADEDDDDDVEEDNESE